MEQRPLYLGKGRGRGRAGNQNAFNSSRGRARNDRWFTRGKPVNSDTDVRTADQKNNVDDVKSASEKRLQAAEQIRESARKFADCEDFEESSSDEEVNDADILSSTLKVYKDATKEFDEDLSKTTQYLIDSCKSGSQVCLICIASLKHESAVWSCTQCYCIFHLQCIQKWALDGARLASISSQDDSHVTEIDWHCPKCRFEFKQSECPTKYYCFCGKQPNPNFDPWLVPHSCGQTCSKPLKPHCGHECLLLCHPGPCPPCPKTVRTNCHCGSQGPAVRRCSNKHWSCGKPCGKRLACGHHSCQTPCHAGECKPCPKESIQSCLCGKKRVSRPCAKPDWQCDQVCGQRLSCGHHTCEQLCHRGTCGDCPRSGERQCPCGKTAFSLPCTEDIPTCGDTCDKELSCGRHHCTQRCHLGACGMCRQMITKRCRCGKREKSVPCCQEFICDIKCVNMRQCNRHQCKRKCCDGSCPPCEQTCGRTLNCHNHKCPSPCHRGLCYPCPLTVDVTCFCGVTVLTLPCGREKVTKPPKCAELCKIAPDCHHPQREKHRCHYGPCPPCRQTCGLLLSPCQHCCSSPCHDRVPDPTQPAKPASSIPSRRTAQVPVEQFISLPCPPCRVPLKMKCLGNHEVASLPCSALEPFSCRRPCGRQLACGNHTCQLECHTVSRASGEHQAGAECQPCEEPCTRPRHPDCAHQCPRPCHPGECAECKQMVKVKCHCQLMLVYVQCSELTSADENSRDVLTSCKNQCPRSLECGHRCTALCHPGPCPSPEKCAKKSSVRCPCRRKKKEFPCRAVQSGEAILECDDACASTKVNKESTLSKEERLRQEEQLRAQQDELESFERKQRGKKRRPRKQQEEVFEPPWIVRHRVTLLALLVSVVAVAGLFYIAVN